MSSLILSSLAALFRNLRTAFWKSGLYMLFRKIYGGITLSWRSSGIMTALRKRGDGGGLGQSAAFKILMSPFTFLEFLQRKIGMFVKTQIEKSCICKWSRTYVQNFMAVNTRFFGVMMLAVFAAYNVVSIARGGGFSRLLLAAAFLGGIAVLMNYNLMSFLNGSKAVDIVKSAAGFKNLDFDFFNESCIYGRTRLVLAALAGIAAGALMTVNPIIGLAAPFAVFAMLLVMYIPVTGVFAAVFAAPFVPTMALAGLCIWTVLSLVIKSLADESFKWRREGMGLSIIIFLGVLLVSSVMSFAMVGSLKVWAMYFVFWSFYFVIINTVKTKEQLYGLLKLFVISGALVALYGIMQYLFGWTTTNAWLDENMFEDTGMRVYSTLGNPNVLGEYLILVLPAAAVYMLKYKFKELGKWAYGAMFLVLALCLVLTQSRGCWIGFMLSVVIFVTFYEGKLWALIPIVLCILPFVVPQSIIDRMMSVGNMNDSSTSYRVYIWMGTLGMLKHYWLGGIGMGEAAFAQVYPFFSYNAIIAPHSHNTFLQLTVESGIGALIVFLVSQGIFMKKMSDTYRLDDKKSLDSSMALALASGVAGFLAQSMFDYTFYNYRVMAVFVMVLAMGISLKYIKEGETA